MSVLVPRERAEEARATLLELHPEGLEEVEHADAVELAVYGSDAGALADRFGEVQVEEVEEGWAERWREFHHGVRVGPLWVGPPWEEPPRDAVPVVIEPGRAFGTGAHPTTRMCLELLAGLPRGSLLDAGCGSGVIAVAAARLGFGPVTAVDYDPAAVEAAVLNARVNQVEIDLRLAGALTGDLPPAEIVAANLTLDTVEALAPQLVCRQLVSSGYLEVDRPALAQFQHFRRVRAGGWAADVWLRR